MKFANTLPKMMAVLLIIAAFASCEEEFNTIGSGIIDQNFEVSLDSTQTVIAYSRKLVPVQTNRLPVYQLGIYNDPTFGKSEISLLSQLTLDEFDPDFGDSTVVESVILYIPYFSTNTVEGEDITYVNDSIYGNTPINISIYESGYFLRVFDPNANFEELQNYYSNQGPLFESFLGEMLLNIEDFEVSDEGFIIDEGEDDETKLGPGLRVELPVEFFDEKIVGAEGTAVLLNNNNFTEYLRGLYFKVSAKTDDGTMFIFDIDDATVTMNYTFESEEGGERFDGEFNMSLSGINVNVFVNELPTSIISDLFNPDVINGEETLYVRGGSGIITVIDLFGDDTDDNGVADELDDLREKEWLINEANLMFYVDQNNVTGGDAEPDRIIIYDINNSTLLVDYNLDFTASNEPEDAYSEHLGILERGSDDIGEYYKIKLTNHISHLINKDSTNVSLGLIVSQNVKQQGFVDLESIQSPGIEEVPESSVIAPRGTVLFGNNTTNENKKLKLLIYYTEPN
jgi:hypothetical protein